jgi:hypothetical protein
VNMRPFPSTARIQGSTPILPRAKLWAFSCMPPKARKILKPIWLIYYEDSQPTKERETSRVNYVLI